MLKAMSGTHGTLPSTTLDLKCQDQMDQWRSMKTESVSPLHANKYM